jgi:hypothetical protein
MGGVNSAQDSINSSTRNQYNFQSNQAIRFDDFAKDALDKYNTDFTLINELIKTSSFAESKITVAAISSGFFNVKRWQRTYLEIADAVISKTDRNDEWVNLTARR